MSTSARDPHDDLLLTSRPTTVVTQATSLLDSAPAPYGSQDEEEFIFAGVAADDGDMDNAARSVATRAGTMTKIPGIAPSSALPLNTPMPAPAQPAPSIWGPVAIVGGIIGLVWLLGGKRS